MANGSVQRKGKVWSFVIDLGPDPATGRRRQARRSGFATEKAAAAALRDLAIAANAGTAVSRSRITVSQFLSTGSCVTPSCPASASTNSATATPRWH